MTTSLCGDDAFTSRPVKHKTLSAYFPAIYHLPHFFSFPLSTRVDPPDYVGLIDTALVAIRDASRVEELRSIILACERYATSETPKRGHSEVVDAIVLEAGRRGKNVISMILRGTVGVQEESLPGQAHKTALHSKSFRLLRSRIGDQAFGQLILRTSIFLSIGNNSYRQVTGQPVYDLSVLPCSGDLAPSKEQEKRKRGIREDRPGKKQKMEHKRGHRPGSGVLGNGQSPAEVILARQRMFYGHPPRMVAGRAVPGLHLQHVLNEVFENGQMADDGASRLMKAVFPRYRFDPSGSITSRTEGMAAGLKSLAVRQRRIDYANLLRICIERSHDHTVDDLQPISHCQIGRYISAVLRDLHGGVLFGGASNLELICQHARRLVEAKQFEPITLHSCLKGLKVSDFAWLSANMGLANHRPTLAESRKQLELVEQLVFWIFNECLVPLLRNSFYITETASTRYQTVYYAYDEWLKASKPHFAKLQEELLEPVSVYEQAAVGQNQLGVSAVRLIPKPNGFRPIVNLGRRAAGGKAGNKSGKKQSANEALRGIHQVLTFEKEERNRDILGSSLFGTNEIFAPLHGLRNELLKLYGRMPRLYFVKMDIKAAFDTIKQDTVLRVVDNLLDQEWGYALVQYCLFLPPASEASQGSSRKLFKTRAVVDGKLALGFEELAREIARPLRNAVVVDMMRRITTTRAELINLLRQHIRTNIWQIGNRYFRQREGIPQGSKISSMLCSIFYAALERQHLSSLTKPGSRLLRYIDDFLYITDNFAMAKRFSAIMTNGFPEYGAYISPGKTMTSFEYTRGQVAPVCPFDEAGNASFPYCGFLIDTKTLEIKPDIPRVLAGDVEQSFALRNARHRGKAFVGWLSRQLENRNHISYLDTAHNSLSTVQLNVWLNFATTAMKIPHYFDKGEDISPHFARVIHSSICASVGYTFVAGRARVRHTVRDAEDGEKHYTIRRGDFEYLAKRAIVKVLTRKAGRFKDVLYLLHGDLAAQQYRAMRARHMGTEERGWEMVKSAKY